MTPEIATVLIILGLSVILFITEKIRVDIVALLVLVALALTNLVTPAEALSGFSSPAVVTVWAVLILGGALARTGVATLIGKRLLDFSGTSEARLIFIIMLTVGVLSGFMNSIGVAALFLPAVIDISRRVNIPPSRLLIPLAFAALMGGMTTLIGTPPNILISESLRQAGLTPFGMFDYTPIGVLVLLAGILFMVLVGRHLLPKRDIAKESEGSRGMDQEEFFKLPERLVMLQLPGDSPLVGMTLEESRLGSILGLNVIAIIRNGRSQLAPSPEAVLKGGDRFLVGGQLDQIEEMTDQERLEVEDENLTMEALQSSEIHILEVTIPAGSVLDGRTLSQVGFRQRFGLAVLAIRRENKVWLTGLESISLHPGDALLVQSSQAQIDTLRDEPALRISENQDLSVYNLDERLMIVHVPDDSSLDGKRLSDSHLWESYGLAVLGVVRRGETKLMPGPDERILAGDLLLVKGKQEDLAAMEGLKSLEVEAEPPPGLEELQSEEVGMVEAVLSPHSTLAGKTLNELHFRAKYGLSVLAIWREGQAYHANLRDMALRFGDALLLFGPREKLRMLGSEPDFLVLTQEAQQAPRLNKAPIAILIMVGVLLSVILGWVNIAIAVVAGVILMVLSGCITMQEAYRSIEWKAVFVIAGMIPLGIAMQQSGAASYLAEGMVNLVGGYGPMAVMAGIFIMAALASQVMPNPAVALLLAPIAMNAANSLGVSPYPLVMTVAVSASAAFLSPVGHSANLLVMGPGGYRFSDFTKVGLPLTLVVLVVVILVVPLIWPF